MITVFLLSFLVDAYIWKDLKARNVKSWIKKFHPVFSGIMWLLLIATILLPYRSANADLMPIMWSLYTYLSIYIPKLFFLIFSALGKLPLLWKQKAFDSGTFIGLPVALFICGVMWYGALVTRYDLEVTEIAIESPDVPEAFDGYKIVQFSDAHVGTWGNDTAFVKKIVDKINSLNPDMIVFTGDIVNRYTDEINPFITLFSSLHATDGVFSILGNHDYGDYMDWNSPEEREANNRKLVDIQKSMGWNLLNNESKFIRHETDSILIIGVENWGEPPFKQYGDLRKAYPDLKDDNFKLLLSHNPEHWRREVVKESNIDLMLAGHTHAMQCVIKIGDWRWSPSSWRYNEWGGLFSHENTTGKTMQLYVNIGVGEVAPFRIGAATPEITLITLKSIPKDMSK